MKAKRDLKENSTRMAAQKIEDAAKAKKDEELEKAQDKKTYDMAMRKVKKDLEELCQSKMPGSKKFDKFWVQGTVQRTFKQKE